MKARLRSVVSAQASNMSVESEQLALIARNTRIDSITSVAWALLLGLLFTSDLAYVGGGEVKVLASWAGLMMLWSLAAYMCGRHGMQIIEAWDTSAVPRAIFGALYVANAIIWLILVAYLFHRSGIPGPLEALSASEELTLIISRLIAVIIAVGVAVNYAIQQSPHFPLFLSVHGLLLLGSALLFLSQPITINILVAMILVCAGGWLGMLAAGLNADLVKRIRLDRENQMSKAQLVESRDEAERLRAAAESASAAKSNFLATMSHELRTPLNAVIGFSDIIMSGYFADNRDRQVEYATDIHTSGLHLLSLVDDVLDIQRIEAGQRIFEFDDVKLMDCLSPVLPLLKERAIEGGVELSVDVTDLVTLYADAQSVRQIVVNLIANAIRHTPQGGKVTLKANERRGTCCLYVIDTGEGIAPEIAGNIFDAFVTGSGDALEAGKSGTGLGLSITRELVSAHGGRIWFRSNPGDGTSFYVLLPKRTNNQIGNTLAGVGGA